MPDVDTEATVGLELLNATDRPVNRLFDASYSFTTASLVSPPPTLSRERFMTTRATDAGGGVAMVTAAAPLTPPLVAMIETLPGANALTRPVDDTVASDVTLLVHAIDAPETGAPFASRATATACVVCPTFRVEELTVTSIRLTVGPLVVWTVMVAEALCPWEVAVMVALPACSALTIPVDPTCAMPGADDDHVIAAPLMGAPETSTAFATRATFWPTIRLAVVGETVMEATATGVTVPCAVALSVPDVAVIFAFPGAKPVRTPDGDTVITAEFEELQTTFCDSFCVPLAL